MILADYVIKYLLHKKITNVFTVSGGGSIILCDALHKNKKIKYISCHHEQAVAFAAESYARYSNLPGAALVTTGPGGTNALTGVASCWIDSIPCIFISGQVFLNQTIGKTGLRQLGVQEINIIDLVKPISKHSVMVSDPNKIKYHLDECFYYCLEGRPGPVWIDIPANIQSSLISEKKLISFKSKVLEKNKKYDFKINKVTTKIKNSKKPLLLLGHGVKISNSRDIILKLINKLKIPFCLTWNATDLIESDNPYYVGRPGAFAERGINFIVQDCDLLISIGTRLPFMVTGYNAKNFAKNAYKIMVDIDQNELDKKNLEIDLKIHGDAKKFISELYVDLLKIKTFQFEKRWLEYCKFIRKKYPIVLPEYRLQKKYVNSYFFIDTLSNILKKGDCVVTDMGLSFVGTHQAFTTKKNQKIFTNSGHAPMGWGLPAAVGAYFASNRKKIICLTGEGGFQMNLQELATVLHHKIPVKIFIYNNGGYLTIKQTQQLGFGNRIMGSDYKSGLSFPNYKDIARAHKIKYIKISNNKFLESKIEKTVKYKGPIICELMMDPEQDQKPKAINRRINNKSIPTELEDMHPFLDKEDLIKNTYESFLKTIKKRKIK